MVNVVGGIDERSNLVPDDASSGVLGAWVADALAVRARLGVRLIDVVASCCLWTIDASGVVEVSRSNSSEHRMDSHSG